jgi:hypothetical protein
LGSRRSTFGEGSRFIGRRLEDHGADENHAGEDDGASEDHGTREDRIDRPSQPF